MHSCRMFFCLLLFFLLLFFLMCDGEAGRERKRHTHLHPHAIQRSPLAHLLLGVELEEEGLADVLGIIEFDAEVLMAGGFQRRGPLQVRVVTQVHAAA